MKTDQTQKTCSLTEAKTLMAEEIRRSARELEDNCYREPFIKRIEIPVTAIDLLDWLAQQDVSVKIYGCHQTGVYAIAGAGAALEVKGDRIGSYEKVFKRLRLFLSPAYSRLQFYGGFCFDDSATGEEWREFGAYRFILPQFELARKEDKTIFCCNIVRHGQMTKSLETVLEELDQIRWQPRKAAVPAGGPVSRKDIPDRVRWDENIRRATDAFRKGEYTKIVLARKTVFRFKEDPDPWAILQQLQSTTPNSYHFCFQFGRSVFLGASPERLFARQRQTIESEAVAGTRPRGQTTDKDEALRAELLGSEKDQREHRLVVDGIKAHLQGLCEKIVVSGQSILSLANGHHLLTNIRGILRDKVRDELVLEKLHPTPAVGGTPKEKVLAEIRKLEEFSRGWYAGPVGFVGWDQAEFVVGIRSTLIQGREMTVYAGAGIVEGSTAQSEWDEIENKISTFYKVL